MRLGSLRLRASAVATQRPDPFFNLPRYAALLVACLSLSSLCPAVQGQQFELMPQPARATVGAGTLSVDGGLQVAFDGFDDARLDRARVRFLAQLSARTGVLRFPVETASTPKLMIHVAGPDKPVEQLGEDESYHLAVTPQGIELSAPNPLGILHGLQTILQLLHTSPAGYVLQTGTIDDRPRFPWRGLMIDVGRHFMPLAVIRQNLDLMEATKLNVFHWHLSDDQGFRIESRTFPLLQAKGSDGMFYTQAEVRDVIAYAHDRGIRVIPEFDMPGHAESWFPGYPDLASGKGPYHIETKWGIFDPAMDPTRDSTYAFLDQFIGEMTALFPDAYFHIGGDECNGKQWDANPKIQQFMRQHALKDDAALQAYFTARVQKLVTAHGKITVGWDEVFQPDTPKDVVIQSWRGQDSLAAAARAGNRGLLSFGYYLDLNEPASQHYAVDPLAKGAANLSPEEKSRILGGEAAEWSEYVTPENISGRIWPRAAAVAERLWSAENVTDTASMYRRLSDVNQSLAWYGVAPSFADTAMFQRLSDNRDREALKVLADVVEPIKEYAREELRDYSVFTPLDRMVDVVPAESRAAREFRALSERIATGHAGGEDLRDARRQLALWRDNDSALEPYLPQSALTVELVPVSQGLSQAAALGLRALDALEKRNPMPEADQRAAMATLKALEAPRAVLLDQAVPGIEILVRAANPKGHFYPADTSHMPAMIPIAMLYSTPEDAAEEIRYLEDHHDPICYVEMGEEADGQYMLPRDYGALYLQYADAL